MTSIPYLLVADICVGRFAQRVGDLHHHRAASAESCGAPRPTRGTDSEPRQFSMTGLAMTDLHDWRDPGGFGQRWKRSNAERGVRSRRRERT